MLHETYVAILVIAALMLCLGATSGLVNNRLWLSEPMLCVLAGVLAGPDGMNWISWRVNDPGTASATVEAARFTLAIAVVGAALRLPGGYLRRVWRELTLILTAGMILTWLIGAALAMLILGWQPLPALLLAGALAPTDPVLAASIVTGRFAYDVVPNRLRDIISAESGANDGLALPLLLLPASLLLHPHDPGSAWSMWWQTSLRELAIAICVGTLSGWLGGRMLRWANRHGEAELTSLVTLALSLALATMAASRLLDADGILACFVAGVWLNESLGGNQEERHDRFHQAISRFFELPFFVLFGALLPWTAWHELGWSGALFALVVLFVRRPLAWLLLWRWLPSLQSRSERLFASWFGPIGIAAVFYALHWSQQLDMPLLWSLVSLVAVLSLLLHGATATPLSRVLIGAARDDR